MCFKCHWVCQGNTVKLSTRDLNQVSSKLHVCRSLGFVTYSSMRECYSLTNSSQNSEAFQGVVATAGDMAQKPGDNVFRKHRQSTEKWEKILKATSDVLYFGLFLQQNNNLYYINTNEIPGELWRENLISSHVKISPLLWLHNKSRLSHQKTIKVKWFCISLVLKKYWC